MSVYENKRLVSIIIPNRNGGATLGKCLEAAQASHYDNFEVIVVDDGSEDNSIEVIARYPCRLIRLGRHGGAARARNVGVSHSRGGILFFTDADCLLRPDALALAASALAAAGPTAAVGGSYTAAPYDRRFCSRFQSAFINYFETRRAPAADYLATHALAIEAALFRGSGGFAEDVRPILEDVEFSHRLRRAGCRLVMDPAIQVQHIFDYSLTRSLRNAFVKSMHWTRYALVRGDLLADSGTAALALKANVCVVGCNSLLLCGYMLTRETIFPALAALMLAFDLFLNRGLLLAFLRAGSWCFAVSATLYYLLIYPLAVGAGAGAGLALYWRGRWAGRR